jgi:hypothetical protein
VTSETPVKRLRWLPLLLLVALTVPASSQRLLIGSWQTRLYESTVTLMIITVDNDGSIHGTLRYDPPQQDGFAGSPFTTRIENGAFSVRLFNGTRYDDMHWCRDKLCGVFHAPDDTATPVAFARPAN